ncbi:hypothetical protein SynA1825c_02207 [Synechococcus sp. A18-25c]|nr:hypothetical protein SynA1825c_02207 [Synechococcus sp. A18-25c]
MFITAEGTLNQSLTPVQRFGLDPFGMLREKSATPSAAMASSQIMLQAMHCV